MASKAAARRRARAARAAAVACAAADDDHSDVSDVSDENGDAGVLEIGSDNDAAAAAAAAAGGGAGGDGKDVLVTGLYVALAGRDLLEHATLKLVHGRRYGLVGANGVGKSTLLRALARGLLPAFPRHLRVVHVEQDGTAGAALLDPHVTPVAWLVASDTELQVLRRQEAAATTAAEVAAAMEALALHDADTAEARARALLTSLRFKAAWLDGPMSALSGGWQMRVRLAHVLYVRADVALLDEPTTHLDLPGIVWLQHFLTTALHGTTVVLISHDRALLNAVATDMIHFADQRLVYYAGDYDAFVQTRAEQQQKQQHLYDWQTRTEAHIHESIAHALQRAHASGDDKALGQVASRRKKLERFGVEKTDDGRRWRVGTRRKDATFDGMRRRVEAPVEERPIVFKLGPPPELLVHGPTLQLRDVSVRYGDRTILTHVSLDVPARGTRLGIVGANGSGKSTVLALLAGTLAPTSGGVVRHHSLRVGVFAQHDVARLDPSSTPVRHLHAAFPDGAYATEHDARQALGGFGLSGPIALQPIRTLSGGQKTRLVLATLALSQPHVLLLDEPSHHLDLPSVEALIGALTAFAGSVVLVAHDQHLLARVATTVYRVERGTLALCDSLDAYLGELRRRVSTARPMP
jgi:ATPase subunit of ABC transporter with duplicated ATPase domains